MNRKQGNKSNLFIFLLEKFHLKIKKTRQYFTEDFRNISKWGIYFADTINR